MEAEYEHECSRAELLGLPKPNKEEFLSRQQEKSAEEKNDEDEITAEEAEDVNARKEGFRRIGGGLDELNSILANTQKKINRFKVVCGSFSNILKLHVGGKKNEDDKNKTDYQDSFEDQGSTETFNIEVQPREAGANDGRKTTTDSPRQHTKKDTNSEIDKLDSLINKAERAELSLSSQNKQMKKFLN